jgi:hypothetical protein
MTGRADVPRAAVAAIGSSTTLAHLDANLTCDEGDKWYNRIGPQMLRVAGLSKLIATKDDEYVHIATKLIHDDKHRRQICNRLAAVDLDATVFDGSAAVYFREAIDYLIAHHDRLQSEPDRRPIRFGGT